MSLRDEVIEALRKVYDPEIPVNIYDIGLVYEIEEKAGGVIDVKMTLTSPNCPVAETLPLDTRDAVESVEGVERANVEIVWDPPWTPDLMSEAAKLQLGFL
jgi:FeS assembly SUF system protein